ncbi:helix-turn-helix domain-containing protein [Clostridium sp. Marseille-P2415]|uniref:helix-turn-helix domain-containing protein n=1 Tax=Clostridium sp. Marseille-P2415 TaxID=1805471 RepID=UPI000988779C|nr:helix-turn-helix transcriptional regulator [Clostridium sp. Marseille-P2415]
MKIGEVIRKYRKDKQLTQEEMANYLGVTAPAVNKWENGNSFPDISLLAPIARLLGISTDNLLSYQEDLTEKEIEQVVTEINARIKNEDYDSVFHWAMKKVQEYPNCDRLVLTVAQLLDSYLIVTGEGHSGPYDNAIHELYKRSLNSSDHDIVQSALRALFTFSISIKEYEQAQDYLNQIPKQGFNPNRFQAILYDKQGKTAEAYELYERLLFSGYGDISWALHGIHHLAKEEGNVAKAERIVEKQKKLAGLLEMGKYMEASPGWELAVSRKDKEAAFNILKDMIHGIKEMDAYKHSELYSHMKFPEHGSETIIFMLKRGFETDDSIDFLRDDERYQVLMEELQNIASH